jgi:UDP-galactopyranose mutase
LPFDYIIVGAGLAGITAAEELANVMNKKVLLIEKRDHIGGNCYDFVNENGTRIHKYGPHVFHTDNTLVYNYLSLFTMWNSHSHKLLFKNEDTLIPVPFNLISVDKILPDTLLLWKCKGGELEGPSMENYEEPNTDWT